MNPGDIHWVELPSASGHEQQGRRPAIILQDESYAGKLPLIIVIPLTAAPGASRFAGTLSIQADDSNNLAKDSVALVFQIRAIDRRIVRERIGAITAQQLSEVYDLLDRLTGNTR